MTASDDYSPLWEAANEPRYQRQKYLREIEGVFGGKVMAYISPKFRSMCHDDIVPFMDLFRGVGDKDPLLLILHTTGGDANVAVKIVNIIRDGGRKFKVLVPEMAKSAGTLLVLGADSILMGKQSELGPIDPQILLPTRDGQVWRPAYSILDGFDRIVDKSKEDPSTALLVMLQSLDIATLDFAEKAVKHAKTEAEKLLREYMLKDQEDGIGKASRIAEQLASVKDYPSHSYAISRDEAEKLGLVIEKLDDDNPLWRTAWRYFCRASFALNSSNCSILFESPRASIVF